MFQIVVINILTGINCLIILDDGIFFSRVCFLCRAVTRFFSFFNWFSPC